MLRLDVSALDYSIFAVYFLVLGIGGLARLAVKTDINLWTGVGMLVVAALMVT